MDDELERIKQRRLEEMKRQLMLKQLKENQETEPEETKKRKPTNQEILDRHFGDRAWEVYNAAVYQYPQVMPQVEQLLVEGIVTGKIRDVIDGAALMGFFLVSAMPIGMQYAAEITYPTPEGTSNGLIQLFGQGAVVFVYIMEAMKSSDGSFTPSLLLALGLLVLSVGITTQLKDPIRVQ